ncbi:hypothetical protein BGW38_002397 [Lunasporangiospora selenospora]|uniref:Uncharacterized protein n=1 Tax=Lunasporangiospora selenospora TaxID=979761 RepID=A0A9P6FSF1_9FUNG|nr:hypothetical protein BGW38_002397 [Lunasporangiospora selenospora]
MGSNPQVDATKVFARAKSDNPMANHSTMSRAWNKLKAFFSSISESDEHYMVLQDFMDIDKVIVVFQAFPYIDENQWPSGAILDDLAKEHALTLLYESSIHSCIIGGIEEILQLARDPKDKKALRDSLLMPPEAELQCLCLHNKSPMEPGPRARQQYPQMYKRNKDTLSDSKSESWYRENVRIMFHDLLSVEEVIQHTPGKHHSEASGQRKNLKRKFVQENQQVGRKVDGAILCVSPELELGVVEAAKADHAGPNSAKTLGDKLKIAKIMKDQFEKIYRH